MSAIREKWNQRYLNKADDIPSVPVYLSENVDQLNPGTVLDLASGDGAAALYLAQQGFAVTAVDISVEGLSRLTRFADRSGVEISTEARDLECGGDVLQGLGQYDNLVLTLYKPVAGLWLQMVDHLKPGGKLFLSTFNIRHHQETGFSKRFCLEEKELVSVHPELQLIKLESTSDNGNWMDHYLFSRR